MKIKPEHYAHIKREISSVVDRIGGNQISEYYQKLKLDSRVKDPDKRLRWDIARLAGLIPYICDELYKYANDEHIDTALRAVLKELGFNRK